VPARRTVARDIDDKRREDRGGQPGV